MSRRGRIGPPRSDVIWWWWWWRLRITLTLILNITLVLWHDIILMWVYYSYVNVLFVIILSRRCSIRPPMITWYVNIKREYRCRCRQGCQKSEAECSKCCALFMTMSPTSLAGQVLFGDLLPPPPGIGSNTSITIIYPAQLMLPDNHGSLVVTSVCLQSVSHMVVVSL